MGMRVVRRPGKVEIGEKRFVRMMVWFIGMYVRDP